MQANLRCEDGIDSCTLETDYSSLPLRSTAMMWRYIRVTLK